MSTLQKEQLLQQRGQDLYDSNGDKIGKIEEIYLDADSGQPEWALVNTGLFGTKSSFVPLRDASDDGGSVTVPYDKSQVKDAPKMDPDGELSREEEDQLYRHYGFESGGAGTTGGSGFTGGETSGTTGTGVTGGAGGTADRDFDGDRDVSGRGDAAGTTGRDTSGPTTDDAMTRSEEELRVGKTERETGRARLRKYVVEDQVTETVPVQREEVRVEREPITDANLDNATSGPDISEEEHEVVLHEEEVVAEKRTVPKERIRMEKDVETDEKQVSETLRKEEVDVDGEGRGTNR
jgi:uncharacterized protein (TIGR02271 family)